MSPQDAARSALLILEGNAAHTEKQRAIVAASIPATNQADLEQELLDLVGYACSKATLYQTLAARAEAGASALAAARASQGAPPPKPARKPTKAERQATAALGWEQSLMLAANTEADLDAALAALDAASVDPDDDLPS